jgi:hypothetical protein
MASQIPLIGVQQQQFQQQTGVEIKKNIGVFFAMQVAPGVTIVNGIGNPMFLQTVREWLGQHPDMALQLVQELQAAIKQDIHLKQHVHATKNE